MKKMVMMIMALVMLFALCSCNNTSETVLEETVEIVDYEKRMEDVIAQVGEIETYYSTKRYENILLSFSTILDYEEGIVKMCLIAQPEDGVYYGRAYWYDVDTRKVTSQKEAKCADLDTLIFVLADM